MLEKNELPIENEKKVPAPRVQARGRFIPPPQVSDADAEEEVKSDGHPE